MGGTNPILVHLRRRGRPHGAAGVRQARKPLWHDDIRRQIRGRGSLKLAPGAKGSWKETILHSFKGGSDGNAPFGGVTFDKSGNLYGTTEQGGDPSCAPPAGCGTVFKLTPAANGQWKEIILHRFNGSDGYGPSTEQLTLDEEGNVYGTTVYGGKSGCGNFSCGVVFEITP